MTPDQPQPRTLDRTAHLAMKTSRPPSTPSAGTPVAAFLPKSSTTPTASSPYFAYSVGQPYPPKLEASSAAVNRLTTPQPSKDASQARTPSPNYFGLAVDPTADPRESAMLPRENWSPATSSVKSFAAAIPKHLPLDANPEFEAFRRQADANRGSSGFGLSTSHFCLSGPWSGAAGTTASAPRRPQVPRWHTYGSDRSVEAPRLADSIRTPSALSPEQNHQPQPTQAPALATSAFLPGETQPSVSMDIDTDASSLQDSAYVSADSKRNSEASLNMLSIFNMPRHASPAQSDMSSDGRTSLSTVEDRHPRLSVTQGRPAPPTPANNRHARAGTVPASTTDSGGPAMISPTELNEILQGSSPDEILLLDLRVSGLYAMSRVQGALNLCTPTTLLKRATFGLQKLEASIPGDEQKAKFAAWNTTKYLVVYDAHSFDKRDATPCINMLKKFTAASYSGKPCILRGGFNAFAEAYPQLVEKRKAGRPTLPLGSGGDGDKPSDGNVIGGVTLPTGIDAAPKPFFGNIRQNLDLADGVGQMDIAVPTGLDIRVLPAWLNKAADKTDHGKHVSDRFLNIERKEQTRMNRAFAAGEVNPASQTPSCTPGTATVEISGIEKGAKNRYKNILPFEHTRVRLTETEGDCDYINASHIKATRSQKRYIASQGPLPATFEDFWSMIWDQDVRVIVMLTAEVEGNNLKCHPYWNDREFGPLKLRALSEQKVSLDMDKRRPGFPSNPNQTLKPVNPSTPGPQSTQPQASTEGGRRRASTLTNSLRPDVSAGGEGFFKTSQSPSQSPPGNDVPIVVVRKFALSHAAHPFAPIREITHLHYSSWPDFGAPANPSHLLALVELANVMQRAALPVGLNSTLGSSGVPARLSPQNSGTIDQFQTAFNDEPINEAKARPMLVHCSAGCGRTGTFCTVDSVMDMLKRQRQSVLQRAKAAAAAAARGKRTRREGVKRKLEQRDSEGDVSMAGLGAGRDVRDRIHHHRRDADGDSPMRASFSVDQASEGGPIFSSPTKFPFPSIARETRGSSFSGSDEGGTGSSSYSYSSSSDEQRDHQQYRFSPSRAGSGESIMAAAATGLDVTWMDDHTIDLVASTVEDFRGQRLSMVQTLRQFVLCYETVLEWVARLQEQVGSSNSSDEGPVALFSPRVRRGSKTKLRSASPQLDPAQPGQDG